MSWNPTSVNTNVKSLVTLSDLLGAAVVLEKRGFTTKACAGSPTESD